MRVKVLLKVDRDCSRLLWAFYVFRLGLCQVSLWCRHLVDWSASSYPALLRQLRLVHFVRLLLKHHFFTHLLILFSVEVLVWELAHLPSHMPHDWLSCDRCLFPLTIVHDLLLLELFILIKAGNEIEIGLLDDYWKGPASLSAVRASTASGVLGLIKARRLSENRPRYDSIRC